MGPPEDSGLPAGGTAQDVTDAIQLLERYCADRALLAALDEPTRRRLLIAAGRLSRPERQDARKLAKEFRRRERVDRRAADDAVLGATGMRVQRQAAVFPTPAPLGRGPEWPPLPGPLPTPEESGPAPEGEGEGEGEREADTERGAEADVGRAAAPDTGAERAPFPELRRARKCYVCKAEYQRVHHFYHSMCADCAELNWSKRQQTADLSGRVAVVTGSRVKIGYQTAILLLRAGAQVVATTRFPRDAAARYAAEPDFAEWGHRLFVHGLDLRHTPSVEAFAHHLESSLPRLDFLINNACQTVRRPPGFYAHLLASEALPFDDLAAPARQLLASHEALVSATTTAARFLGVREAPRLSQLATDADRTFGAEIFPAGRLDQDLQQVDLRDQNSWRLTLAEVPTVELLEVQLVNAVAPFVLCSKLKPLMLRPSPTRDRHVVNVSAMEGQFYRAFKTDKHPHTNMAKAALNMLTRTSAADYVKDGIHMNSVDTGWVTDEDPLTIAARKTEEHGFHPPLDIVDGAARIVDPIFSGFRTGVHPWGRFFKDYLPVRW